MTRRRGPGCRAAGLLAAAALSAAFGAQAPPATGTAERLLVVPFENVAREPGLYWLTEGVALLLADALSALGVPAIARDERVRAYELLQLPVSAPLTRATVIRVGEAVGATRVIGGSLRLDGGELVVTARAVRLDAGRLDPELSARAPLAEIELLVERLARQLAGAPPDRPIEAPRVPLPAFESYVKGLLAEQTERKIAHLETALRLHPRYDRAQLALWEVYTERGDHEKALTAAQAVPLSSRLSRRARFRAALSLIELRRYAAAFELLTALAAERPAAAVHNALGVVQLRRGWTPQTGRPTYYFDQATKLDAGHADYFFNLGYAYAREQEREAAIYWLREAVRRNPADGEAHLVLAALLQAGGETVEAGRERELAQQLDPDAAALAARAAGAPLGVPEGLERLETVLEPSVAALAAVAAPQRENQQAVADYHLAAARRLFEEGRDREAVAELRRTIYLSPYSGAAHLLLGRIYLRTARVREAIDAFKIAVWSEETAAARIALGEAYLRAGDRAAARVQAERALALDPASAEAARLLERAR
ncbi:MAG TPA: tetratricopeptide repeat protein [Vicinamibacterales bacterium]|nr:tetratricopeptide repeat protein [Vicinamibacterales bacterium]